MNRKLRVILLAVVLAGAVFSEAVLARPAENQPPPSRPQGKGQEYGPEANPEEVFKETKGRPALRSKGVAVRQLHGRQAGKPISAMPGAKAINRGRWAEMKDIPKTGLFLVDLDHIPPGLEEDLKKNGYRLAEDGTLTKNGEPVALFVHGETFEVKPEKAAGPPGGGRSGGLAGLVDWTGRTLSLLADSVGSLLVSEAEAAQPFPWACGSWYFRWEYHGGFCRDYQAWSHAYSWGPGSDGGCADPKPLTRIEYISAYVSVPTSYGWDYHYNADQAHAYAKWDIGCWWPAHVAGSGFHYAYWRDGSAWMYRTWSW